MNSLILTLKENYFTPHIIVLPDSHSPNVHIGSSHIIFISQVGFISIYGFYAHYEWTACIAFFIGLFFI